MTTTSTMFRTAPERSLRLQCACTLVVALGAAYVSYRHGREFALRFGADDTAATLWPLIVDGLLTMATIELWKTSHRHRTTGRWKAWLSFTLGIGLSLCANIASAPELSALSIAVAACPPLALLLSVELLNQALKRCQEDTAKGTGQELDESASPQPHSPNTDQTNTSSEAPETAPEAPDPRTVMNNAPRHSAVADSMPPHGDIDEALREEAYRLDAEHWQLYQRPISADTLRRKLGIGSARARALTHHIRQQRQPITKLATVMNTAAATTGSAPTP